MDAAHAQADAAQAERLQRMGSGGSVDAPTVAQASEIIMALYHDQGHIAIKVHNFEDSITATMGIPFIRTSVDHGTAFDIAGKNLADASGLAQALEAAVQMIDGNMLLSGR